MQTDSDPALPCPICGSGSLIANRGGRLVPSERAWLRVRRCTGPEGHEFETFERVNTADLLRTISVRTAAGVLAPFDRNVLLRDLSWTVGQVLTKKQRNEVAASVEAALVSALPPRRIRGRGPVVGSDTIVDAVRQQLGIEGSERTRDLASGVAFRRALMLWELARGRFGGPGDGFDQLGAIEQWLDHTYPGLGRRMARQQPSRPHYLPGRVDAWHPLKNDAAPHPTSVVHTHSTQHTVITRSVTWRTDVVLNRDLAYLRTESAPESEETSVQRGTDQTEYVTTAFKLRRFQTSVTRAFHGREDAGHRTQYTVQWVLWSLAGQNVVRASDLAAVTTQCLRRVDAVAYLRWSVPVKNLDVEGLWREIHGLLDWPASRLTFPAGAAADHRVSHQFQPDLPDQMQ